MNPAPIEFLRVKVIALPVVDAERAHRFYSDVLCLRSAQENGEKVGFFLGETVLMLKHGWNVLPTDTPNPRVTLEVENAKRMEQILRERGVVISDPVECYGEFNVGGFLDSEGNKLWFCSPA